MSYLDKIKTQDQLAKIREELRKQKKIVVQCHGCFDIVHPGHIRYLNFARELGDILIISVTSDDMVGKGENRPYINQDLRLENLAVLEFVDYVCLDNQPWGGPVLEKLKPDIYVKGKEYETKNDPRMLEEKELVEKYGGQVVFSSGDIVYSSTYIIEHLKENLLKDLDRFRFYCRRYSITRESLLDLIHSFRNLNILVLGDPILDRYIHCDTVGIASESPIMSVTPISEEWYVGGAGLIADQISGLGARSTLLAPFGKDANASRFRVLLAEQGTVLRKIPVEARPVFLKQRYLVENQKILKVENKRYIPLPVELLKKVLRRVSRSLAEFHAVLAVDFGYGFFPETFVEELIGMVREAGKPFFGDVSHSGRSNILKFKRATIVTPTEQELRFAMGDHESGPTNLASRFYALTEVEHLILTLGEKGLLILERPNDGTTRLRTDYLPSMIANPLDTIGCGDELLAGVSLSFTAGASIQIAAYLGNCFAALHGARRGNVPVRLNDLLFFLESREELR